MPKNNKIVKMKNHSFNVLSNLNDDKTTYYFKNIPIILKPDCPRNELIFINTNAKR